MQVFLLDVGEALKRHKFYAIKQLLRASQEGELEAAGRGVESRLRELEADIAGICEGWRQGAFRSFASREMKLGDEVLVYPPPEVAALAEAMYRQLAQPS